MSGPINQLSEKQKRLAMFLVSLTNNNLYKDGEILKRDFEGELTKIYGNDTADNIITKGGIRDTVIEFEFIDNKYYIYPDTYYKLHHFGRAKTQEIIDSFFPWMMMSRKNLRNTFSHILLSIERINH